MDYCTHHVPGRLRVKTHIIKKNKFSANNVEIFLKQLKGINSATTNIITGSIVILYDHKIINFENILASLENEGYFDTSKSVPCCPYANGTVSKTGQTLGKILFGVAIEKTFENSILSYITVFI